MASSSQVWLSSILKAEQAEDEDMQAEAAGKRKAEEAVGNSREPLGRLQYEGDPGLTPPEAFQPTPGCHGGYHLIEPWATYDALRRRGERPYSVEYLAALPPMQHETAAEVEPNVAAEVEPDGDVKVQPDGAVNVETAAEVEPDVAVKVQPDGDVKMEPDGAVEVEPDGAVKVEVPTGWDLRNLEYSGQLPAVLNTGILPQLKPESPPLWDYLRRHEQYSDHSYQYALTMDYEPRQAEDASRSAEEPFGCNG